MPEVLFRVDTPLGFSVHTTRNYWDFLTTFKHRSLAGKEDQVKRSLQSPTQIRRSRVDTEVYLFYGKAEGASQLCVVVKRLNGDGFIVTAYFTENIKEGEQIWTI